MADDRSRRQKLRAMAENGTEPERAIARSKLGLPRQLYWILEGREVRSTDDVEEWAQMFEDSDRRRVGLDEVGDASVSTVFLGIDHNYASFPSTPILFETMIFGGPYSDFQARYRTYDEAEAGHAAIVAALRAGQEPPDVDVR